MKLGSLIESVLQTKKHRKTKAVPGPGVYGCETTKPKSKYTDPNHWNYHDHSLCQKRLVPLSELFL